MPELSVVMGVYNGGAALTPTIDSVCAQEGVDFEFIIVDDGSRDDSGTILKSHADRDSRIRVITQENAGLTRALIRGCENATAPVIARQDVGDRSLSGRLRAGLDLLTGDPANVLASCGTRFVSPEGEHLYDVTQTSEAADQGLHVTTVEQLCGPSHHGAAMFRRDSYEQAGGYRSQLWMAQDMDLWLRLAEQGRVVADPAIHYEAEIGLGGISAGRTHAHEEIGAAILRGAALRARGESETDNLAVLDKLTRQARDAKGRRAEAAYFIGSCLKDRNPALARSYFRRTIKTDPMHLRGWVALGKSMLAH